MRVIISGGGTGGHVYPAIAIAEKIKRKEAESSILFIGTKRGMESLIVPEKGYEISYISAKGLNRKKPLEAIKTAWDFQKGYREAKKIIGEFKPEKVIGTGGYVSLPALYAAVKMKIPIYIHEQNAYPGLANKLLAKHAKKIFISFLEAKTYFKNKENIVLTGNPIRKEFILSSIVDYREKLGIGKSEFLILSFGGSRGADKINEAIGGLAEVISKTKGLRLVHITGKNHYDKFLDKYIKDKNLGDRVEILPYTDKIHEYMSAADVIISRSGAITVSEIAALGKPSILIPSPNVTADHQRFNAKALSDKGGAILLEEKDLSIDKIKSIILKLFNNKEALNKMANISRTLGNSRAADEIYLELKDEV